MKQNSDASKYIRVCKNANTGDQTKEVWGLTYKCASTSMLEALPQPRMYTDLRSGDHVRIIVRDPRDRLVSAWKWFTTAHTSYRKAILDQSPADHEVLMGNTPFKKWAYTALRYWDGHWAPQTEIHKRWREFDLIPIHELHTLGWGHKKRTRSDNEWGKYYDRDMLSFVEEVYREDLEMWEVIKDGTDTGSRRIL